LEFTLEVAKAEQVEGICNLVNVAYRGKSGWTKETNLVGGDRTNTYEIQGYLSSPNAHLLVASVDGKIVACVCIEKDDDRACIGLLAVHPKLQGDGVGKEILHQAERYASKNLNAKKYIMVVVSQRTELIAYYKRRGYIRTGEIQKYPTNLNVGIPLKNGLTIEYLEKSA